ncbi:MAG: C25 family cysteine peptidase [Methanobacteriota archaeon]
MKNYGGLPSKKTRITPMIFLVLITLISPLSSLTPTVAEKPIQVNPQLNNENTVITLAYTFTAPLVHTVNDRDYLSLTGSTIREAPGEPSIPVKDLQILLPPHSQVETITVTPDNPTILPGSYFLANGQEPVPLSSTKQVTETPPNPTIYKSTTSYPSFSYETIGPQQWRGYTILYLTIPLIQYNPKEGIITYYPAITVTVTTKPIAGKNETDPLYRTLVDDETILLDKIENSDMISQYLDHMPYHNSILAKYDLLIITNETFRTGFQRLAIAHNREGIWTIIKTLGTDINVSQNRNQTCTNIRDFIRTAYRQWGIDYVLIGGDFDIIPAISMMGEYPSDHYYACLDGPFNYMNDRYWGSRHDGENGGEVDFLAEVYVGRACVGNLTEVNIFVNKTLKYMNMETTEHCLNTILMLGQYLSPGVWGGNLMDKLIGYDPYYGTNGIPEDQYTINKLYDRDWELYGWDPPLECAGGWPKELLINQINNGTYIINHLGHSGTYQNMKLYLFRVGDPRNDLDLLNNTKLCFIYSQGCHAGAFDLDAYPQYGLYDCIAEYLTVKRPTGAFAGIWYSREGWIGPSNWFNAQFWDAVFTENISIISVANQDSKEDNLYRLYTPISYVRNCYYELNLLGDPTLSFKNRPLQADVHGPYNGLANESIQFRGSAYSATYPIRWYWEFGDGELSRVKNPVHRYSYTGNYTVRLTVIDKIGRRSSDTTTANITLHVTAEGPYEALMNETVQFTGSITGGFPPYNYSWDFGDHIGYSWEQNPTYRFQNRGVFTIILTVTDFKGNKGINTTMIQINPSTVWVDDDNRMPPWDGTESDPFPTITMALEIVNEGGTIYVKEGTYLEDISISRSVNLIGLDTENTCILGGEYRNDGALINIFFCEWVNITGFSIRANARYAGGLSLFYSNHVTLTNNIIGPILPWDEPLYGVDLIASSACIIDHNQINNNGVGVYMYQSYDNIITRNTISQNTWAMSLDDSYTNKIYHNNFISNPCFPMDNGGNQWDNGYLDGGNYWSDFDEPHEGAYDEYHGEYQNITGADFIVDLGPPLGGLNPYTHIVGGGGNRDWYPFIIPNAWDSR